MDNERMFRIASRLEEVRLNRRRFLKWGAAGAGMTLLPLLAACGGDDEIEADTNPTSDAGDSDEPVTVKFEGWTYEPPLVEQNIARFTDLNPNITVDYTPIEGSQYRQKLVAEFLAGAEPDALYVRDDYFAGWVTAGYLQDIEGMSGVDEIYDKIYDYNADAMSYEGKRYGLPYYADIHAFIYNEEMLAEAGISEPPKSLSDLEEQGKKLQEAGIVDYPLALALKQTNDFWYNWWALIYASGAQLFNDDMEPIMHTENTVARDVLTWIDRALNESGVVDPASIELDGDQIRDAFFAGQYAFTMLNRYDIERANDPETSQVAGKAKMALIPSLDGENKGTVGWTRMYCLSANTQVKDDAYKLMYYLGGLDEEGDPYTARFWFRERGLGFAYRELSDDPEIQELLEEWVDPTIYAKQAETARARENIKEPWYSEWESANQALMQQALIGQISIDEAMNEMADNAERMKKEFTT